MNSKASMNRLAEISKKNRKVKQDWAILNKKSHHNKELKTIKD